VTRLGSVLIAHLAAQAATNVPMVISAASVALQDTMSKSLILTRLVLPFLPVMQASSQPPMRVSSAARLAHQNVRLAREKMYSTKTHWCAYLV